MSSALPPLFIEGVAFWSARLPSWNIARAAMRGEVDAPAATASRPTPALLQPTERRRASDTVAVALEVAASACAAADRSPQELPSIFASTFGDLAISDYMCTTLVNTPALVSPIKFHNSVHNAAAGYWTIASGSYAPYTAISAYRCTFAAGLLEAAVHAIAEDKPVLYVAFDIESRGALATVAPSRGSFGVALVIAPHVSGRRRIGLELTVQSGNAAPYTHPQSDAAALVADNALAPCLPFFEALASDTTRTTLLGLSRQTALHAKTYPIGHS
jgi:hypothetical protein